MDNFVEKKLEKYAELLRRGKTISDLRSIRNEKEEKIRGIESRIQIKKTIIRNVDLKERSEKDKKIDDLENKKFKLKVESYAIKKIILREDDIGSEEENNEEDILVDDYNPLKYTSAEEAKDYGFDVTTLRRIIKIERWLDKNHPKWFTFNVPSESKRNLESHFDSMSKSTVNKYISRARDKKRINVIREYLNRKYEEWEEKEISDRDKEILSDLLNISIEQIKKYLKDLRWNSK